MHSGASSETENAVVQLRIVVLGESKAGKTSLIQSFCAHFDRQQRHGVSHTAAVAGKKMSTAGSGRDGSFDAAGHWRGHYKPTTGVEFYTKQITLPRSFGLSGTPHDTSRFDTRKPTPLTHMERGDTVVLRFWDVGGDQLGSRMLTNYLYEADAVCLVYDVSDVNALQQAQAWYDCVRREIDRKGSTPSSPLLGRYSNTSTPHLCNTTSDVWAAPSAERQETKADATIAEIPKDNSSSCSTTNLSPALSAMIRTPLRTSRHQRVASSVPSLRGGRPLLALLGTKTDVHQAVPRGTHARFASERHMDRSFLVSARTGDCVVGAFLQLVADLLGHAVVAADLDDFGLTTPAGSDSYSATEERECQPRYTTTQVEHPKLYDGGLGNRPRVDVEDCAIM